MRPLIVGSLVVFLISSPLVLAQDAAKSPDDKPLIEFNPRYKVYKQLVERAKNNDPTVNYVELIAAFWDVSDKIPKAPNRDAMSQAFKDKNYALAVELAETIQDNEFQNRNLHLAMANAYEQLGDRAKADLHRAWADKLLNAVLSTGDGKTVQTAYCVQGISEEYQIMEHFGYKTEVQGFMIGGYDVLSGTEESTGNPVRLYFDISGNVSRCVQAHQQKKN